MLNLLGKLPIHSAWYAQLAQRYGFFYKKPALVPGKTDEQQQRKWMAQYEKLKQDLPTDETICFMDRVHPTHNVQPAYGWIQKGVRKEIPANSGRSRINLSGVLDVIEHRVLIFPKNRECIP